jgi:glucoamylase
MMQYAEWLLKNGNSTYVEKSLWPVIQLDLDYVATYWREPTSGNSRPYPRFFD